MKSFRSYLRRRRNRGFVLFEAMLAVGIFALGVLALGQCVENCLRAEVIKREDARARRLLENRMTEIEGGMPVTKETITEELKAPFEGMTLKQTRVPLKRKNEKDEEIAGIFAVTLEVAWKSRGEVRTRTLQFYHAPRTQ